MNEEYWELRILARNYYNMHREVTKQNNRLGALKKRGLTSEWLLKQRDLAESAKKETEAILIKRYKESAPADIVKFQQQVPGLGATLMAQLVGCVGDFKTYTEAWWEEADPEELAADAAKKKAKKAKGEEDDAPSLPKRTLVTGDVKSCGVREVWAYCGHGDASLRRRKGMTQQEALAGGNVLAKTIVHLISDFGLRFDGKPDKLGRSRPEYPYRWLYLERKAEVKERHPDWTAAHAHRHGVRVAGKALLKDIWRIQHGQEAVYGAPTPWTPSVRDPAAT
jgi:hypothetical protein